MSRLLPPTDGPDSPGDYAFAGFFVLFGLGVVGFLWYITASELAAETGWEPTSLADLVLIPALVIAVTAIALSVALIACWYACAWAGYAYTEGWPAAKARTRAWLAYLRGEDDA